jgi:hypothetical protein
MELARIENMSFDKEGVPKGNGSPGKEVLDKLRMEHLNSEERNILENTCLNYQDIFYLLGNKLSSTNAMRHSITLVPGTTPINTRPYRLAVPKTTDASGERKWRILVDFKKLNERTIGNAYLLPDITEILNQLGQSKYFSCIDMVIGYHHIEY